jgi:hypothetical protein
MISFDVRSIEGVEALLKDLKVPLAPILSDITFASAELLQKEMAVYPGPSHQPVLWASAAERARYHAQRRTLGLPLKYQRTTDYMSRQLLEGWSLLRTNQTDTLLSNRVHYGPFVQSAEFQSPQHKATGWITDKKGIANVERSGDVERVAQRIVARKTAFKD